MFPEEAEPVKHSLEDSMSELNLTKVESSIKSTDTPPVVAAIPAPEPKKKKKDPEPPKITVKLTDRNKRKHITTIAGLEQFDIDLKKAAKLFAGKFACGSSVTKSPQGYDEITIQGDVIDTVVKVITDNYKVSQDSITIVQKDPKKK